MEFSWPGGPPNRMKTGAVLMVVVATASEQVKDPIGEALEFECRRFGALEGDRQPFCHSSPERKRNGWPGGCWRGS